MMENTECYIDYRVIERINRITSNPIDYFVTLYHKDTCDKVNETCGTNFKPNIVKSFGYESYKKIKQSFYNLNLFGMIGSEFIG